MTKSTRFVHFHGRYVGRADLLSVIRGIASSAAFLREGRKGLTDGTASLLDDALRLLGRFDHVKRAES